jgi:hypothetical protein
MEKEKDGMGDSVRSALLAQMGLGVGLRAVVEECEVPSEVQIPVPS